MLRFPKNSINFIIHPYSGLYYLNKYIIAFASIGLPNVNLWATRCVTKRPQNAAKTLFSAKHCMFRAKIYPKKYISRG